jgi:hypothetical protein
MMARPPPASILAVLAASVSCVSYALPPDDAQSSVTAAVTIKALAPPSNIAPGGPMSPVWAAWQVDDGAWQRLMPKDVGLFTLPSAGSRWAVAFACEDIDRQSSTIAIYRHPASVTAIEITLPEPCSLPPIDLFQITGTLVNVPQATSWLEFGYALDSRGSALPVDGTRASYEVVNVATGTWDLAFGVRDTAGAPLTRAAILRARPMKQDLTLDVDLAAAFAPAERGLKVHGVGGRDTVDVQMLYTTGGTTGLAVGPQDIPSTSPEVFALYSTIPDTAQVEGDRYRLAITSSSPRDEGTVRSVDATFHAAMDLDLTLPDAIAPPRVTVLPGNGGVQYDTAFSRGAGIESFVVDVVATITHRSYRRVVTSIDASIAAPSEMTPDWSGIDGFRPEWALPDAETVVTVTNVEPSAQLGDGTMQRSSAAFVVVR